MERADTASSEPATRFVGGTVWMLALRWIMRAIGLVSTIVLARLLTPQDFGLVAMAMVVYALVDSMATTGVDLALIRDQRQSTELYDAAWTIQVLQGIFIAVVMLVAAPFAIDYFQESRLQNVLSILALSSLIQGFRNIGTVAFRKELDFAKEFRFVVFQKLGVFVITVGLAFWLRDYRAMVLGLLSQSIIELLLSYRMHPHRSSISTRGIGEIWGFSQWLLISRIGMVINEKAGQLIVGRAVGSGLLGVYYIGVEIGTIFVYEVVMPVRRALFPNLARIQHLPEFPQKAIEVVGLLLMVCVPVGFGLHIVAEPFVYVFFGDKWLDAIPVLSWMAFFGTIVGINLSLDLILLVKNRADLTARKAWIEVLFLVPGLIYAAHDGKIVDVAIARVAIAALFVPLMIYYAAKVLEVNQQRVYQVFARPLLAGTCMLIIDSVVQKNLHVNSLVELFQRATIAGLSYLICIFGIWILSGRKNGPEKLFVEFIGSAIKK